MKKDEICNKLEFNLSPIIENLGYEIVCIDYLKENRNWIVRIYIDNPDGISLDDCEKVSRTVDAKIDELNLIEHFYLLEVCSPGLDRPLIKDKDFIRFQGKKIKVKTKQAVGDRKSFTGIIKDFKEGILHLETIDIEESLLIKMDNIRKANLVIEI